MPKVFGIGFHKTGTKSLAQALRLLGHNVMPTKGFMNPNIRNVYQRVSEKRSHRFDAFTDNPWPLLYREMDILWPDAKFILTIRDHEKWLASARSHFNARSTPMRELVYGEGRGCVMGNEDHYVHTMKEHTKEAIAYFNSDQNKLLVMDFEAGDGWALLCPFLGYPIPDEPFPHLNKAKGATLRIR